MTFDLYMSIVVAVVATIVLAMVVGLFGLFCYASAADFMERRK